VEMKRYNGKGKVLIVDDNEASRILVIEILVNLNLTIIETGYAEEAICFFNKYNREIALVLIDIRLPGWDGCELLKQFRIINPFIPAIAISALRPLELAAKSKTAGFNEWMSKPFDIDEFIKMVSTYV
jgi:DNA-binding NtrC family response regulator